MAATQTEAPEATEVDEVVRWRFEVLVRAGYDLEDAFSALSPPRGRPAPGDPSRRSGLPEPHRRADRPLATTRFDRVGATRIA